MKELTDILRMWQRHDAEPLALATLVQVEGSSYRRPGARMLIARDGSTAGGLSGGCLEEEVAQRALEVLRRGEPATMRFDTRRRFGCSGAITIFIERVQESFLAGLHEHLEKRRSCAAITFYDPDDARSGTRLLAANEIRFDGAFVQEIEAPLRLLIYGEGPDGGPLRAFAAILGWQVLECPQTNALAELPVDARTAAIVKSHNYGRDCAALRHLLPLGLRYVALLGPRKRRDELLRDLLDSGVAVASELFAPAGFDLNAETPEEIALAIVAEIQAVFAEASGESLRQRKAPIHGWNLLRNRAPAAACAPLLR